MNENIENSYFRYVHNYVSKTLFKNLKLILSIIRENLVIASSHGRSTVMNVTELDTEVFIPSFSHNHTVLP